MTKSKVSTKTTVEISVDFNCSYTNMSFIKVNDKPIHIDLYDGSTIPLSVEEFNNLIETMTEFRDAITSNEGVNND